MKRRKFVSGLLATPAVATLTQGQTAAPPASQPSQQQQPQPKPVTPAQQNPRQPQAIPQLKVTAVDIAAEAAPHFFTAEQMATLTKLAAVVVPPLKGNPGAVDAQAPAFLDFLLSVSPPDRQHSYQFGLDTLNKQAQEQHGKAFAQISPSEVGAILKPLLIARPWPEDLPQDPMQSFVAQVHEDLQTATRNSREWAAASEKSGRLFTRGFRGSGYYWAPIDPISQG